MNTDERKQEETAAPLPDGPARSTAEKYRIYDLCWEIREAAQAIELKTLTENWSDAVVCFNTLLYEAEKLRPLLTDANENRQ